MYVVSALIGLIVYLIAFGPAHMFGTSGYWDLPQEDSRSYLMGYRYWLHEPWHWPLFISNTINVPYPKSIAFNDSIPIFAFVNKAIATLIPPWGEFTERAYLGLWHALVYMLQASMGVALMRQLRHRTWGDGILAAVFFLAVPTWVIRYGHAALTAHFLLLWALLLYLKTPVGHPPPRRLAVTWLALLAITALVNPYHSVMCLGVFAASMLRTRTLKAAAWFPIGVVAIGVFAWIAGYFSREARVAMGGFDQASSNLLSMVIPRQSGLFGDGQRLAKVVATEYQYEGWAYLGIGFLVMLALFLPRARLLGGVFRRHAFLLVVLCGAWLLSLSNKIYFGSHLIVSYTVPRVLHWIPDQFRAPGRFIWVPMYVIMVFLLSRSLGRFRSRRGLLVLPVLALLQVADTRGDWRWPQMVTAKRYASLVDIDLWRPFVHAHDAVIVNPPYDCVIDGTPYLDEVSREIQFLASRRAIPINGTYSARPTRDCAVEARQWPTLKPEGNTLYVFFPRLAQYADRFQALGATCGEFEYGRACSNNRAAMDLALMTGVLHSLTNTGAAVTALAIGEQLAFDDKNTAEYVTAGWSFVEPGGRWTEGPIASMMFRFDAVIPSTLKIQASAALCGKRGSEDVEIVLNGVSLGTLQFDPSANDNEVPRSIPLGAAAKEILQRTRIGALDFYPKDTRTPKQIGCNEDTRSLGLWVRRLWFE